MASPDLIKKVLEDFIKIYRTHPCLWQINSKEYHDREKKEAAFKLLIKKLREIKPEAADEVYHFKAWYHGLFDFLHEQCFPRESSSNLNINDENSCEGDNTQESSAFDQQYSSNGETINSGTIDNNEAQSRSSHPPKPDKVKRKYETIADDSDGFGPDLTEDRYDVFGKYVAVRLRTLDPNKMLVVERLINHLLFEAEIGHLTPNHAYINMRDILRQYVPAQQYQQQVHYQSPASTFNRPYTPESLVSSGISGPEDISDD